MKLIENSFCALIIFLLHLNATECKNYHCNVKILDLQPLDLSSVVTCEFYRAIVKINDTIDITYNFHPSGVLANSTIEEVADLVTQIKFRNSNLATIPNRLFMQFPSTKILDASHSKLKSISSLSLNKSNLTKIFLYHNKLETVSNFVFVHCPELEILDLSQNEIATIETFAFTSLSKVERLDLSQNKIKNLENGIFQNLTNLQWLWLSSNKITRISMNLFTTTNKNLMTLYLNNNQISSISPNAFDFLINLKFLFLSGNICINLDFKNHVIHDNLAIAYELKKCIKKHRDTHKYEPDRNLTLIIEEVKVLGEECQMSLQLQNQTLSMYEVAIKEFLPPTTENPEDDQYYEEIGN